MYMFMTLGRNLQKYTSSGAFSSALSSVNNYDDPFIPTNRPLPPDRDISEGDHLIWSQTNDEVEIRITGLPSSTSAKSITVNIKPTKIHVSLPPGIQVTNPESIFDRLVSNDGAELYGLVHPGDMTWSLENSGSGKTLAITLSKVDSLNWLSLLK